MSRHWIDSDTFRLVVAEAAADRRLTTPPFFGLVSLERAACVQSIIPADQDLCLCLRDWGF
jgi:hypothetical protein